MNQEEGEMQDFEDLIDRTRKLCRAWADFADERDGSAEGYAAARAAVVMLTLKGALLGWPSAPEGLKRLSSASSRIASQCLAE